MDIIIKKQELEDISSLLPTIIYNELLKFTEEPISIEGDVTIPTTESVVETKIDKSVLLIKIKLFKKALEKDKGNKVLKIKIKLFEKELTKYAYGGGVGEEIVCYTNEGDFAIYPIEIGKKYKITEQKTEGTDQYKTKYVRLDGFGDSWFEFDLFIPKYADGGGVDKVYKLIDGENTWYLTYLDSTHFFLSNTKEYKGSPYHIGEFRSRPFYNEVLSWLNSNKGKMAKGGGVDYNENREMVLNNNKQIAHHTKELQSAVKGKEVPAWVVAKVNRSASDLSDSTHYMEGQGKSYADGGGVGGILKLYKKSSFSDSDSEMIEKAIDSRSIETDEIKEDFMDYAYERIKKEFGDKYSSEQIWSYTDENYSNGLTHKENYDNLIEFLTERYANGGGVEGREKIMELYSQEVSDLRRKSYPKISVSQAVKLASEYMLLNYSKKELKEAINNDRQIQLFGMQNTWLNALNKANKYADGGGVGELKKGDFVWNAIGKKLIVREVNNDEYFLEGFGSISPQPFSKYKVNNYIKSGEWTLNPKMAKGGGSERTTFDVFDGLKTIADFPTKKEALDFCYRYELKYPKAKLEIKTFKYANGGGVGENLENYSNYDEFYNVVFDYIKREENLTEEETKDICNVNESIIEAEFEGGSSPRFTSDVVLGYLSNERAYKNYAKGGVLNGNYLDTISADKKNKILKNIANNYGFSIAEALAEVVDADAEMLYEYISNDQLLRMSVYNDIEGGKFAKGTSIKGLFSKAKELGSKGYGKAKELTKKGVDATKKAIHDKKKEIALDVLYETKENLAEGRDEKNATEKAFRVVDERFAKGGGVGLDAEELDNAVEDFVHLKSKGISLDKIKERFSESYSNMTSNDWKKIKSKANLN